MMAIRSPDQLNSRSVAKVGTSAAATQVVEKIDIGRGAEQPGGGFRQHHLLVQQAQQVAIGLQHGGAAAALQPRLQPAAHSR